MCASPSSEDRHVERAQLDAFRTSTIKNTVGLEVGRMEITLPLERRASAT